MPAPVAAPGPGGGPGFVLREIVLEGAGALGASDLQPIWADLIGQPVTLAALDEVVAGIGAAYRARGYVLSQAALPAQTIEDGRVRVLVIEGFIDRVALTGGAPNQQTAATRLFAPVVGERPTRLTTLERSVLLSRDTFGGTVETVLEPSPTTFGAADLGVLLEPDTFTGFGALDNRGSRLYGAWTAAGGGSAYNLLGLNEHIDVLVAVAPENASLAFGQATLDVPLPALAGTLLDGGRLQVGGNISRADPDLSRSGSPEDLDIIQHETNLRTGLYVPFIRTRSQNLFGHADLVWRESESETGFAGEQSAGTDRLVILDVGASWDRADRFGGVTLIEGAVHQGLPVAGAEIGETGPAAGHTDFTLATLKISRLQRLGASDWSVYGEVIGQLASTVLPNSERFSLGDATIGRGFAPGNTTGDSGYGGRIELRHDLAAARSGGRLEAAELYVFADHGRAYDRSIERDGEAWESLGSVGIGARIDVRPWLTLTPEIARQTDGVATDTTDPDHQTRFYIGAVARF